MNRTTLKSTAANGRRMYEVTHNGKIHFFTRFINALQFIYNCKTPAVD